MLFRSPSGQVSRKNGILPGKCQDDWARPISARPQQSLHPPRRRFGGTAGGRRRPALSVRVLADFSGYIAADELYDGPYCVLSIVDNHRFTRLIYEVLDHNPTEEDITKFFTRFHEALKARGLSLKGVTTDGSPLYPKPIAQVFGPIPHQVCQFHVIAELNKAVLKAVAKVRRQRKATLEKALTFLDDSLLPATSNAVKRGNRGHRKMQKAVYRVRTGQHISQRIAVDMLPEAQAQGRLHTIQTLHYDRTG